jgi:hypothetical protein
MAMGVVAILSPLLPLLRHVGRTDVMPAFFVAVAHGRLKRLAGCVGIGCFGRLWSS